MPHHSRNSSDIGKSILSAALKGEPSSPSFLTLREERRIEEVESENEYLASVVGGLTEADMSSLERLSPPIGTVIRSEYVQMTTGMDAPEECRCIISSDSIVLLECKSPRVLFHLPFKLTAVNIDSSDSSAPVSLLYSEAGSPIAIIYRITAFTNHIAFGDTIQQAKNQFTIKSKGAGT